MKALSLWQPWASLMAYGLKEYETRGWGTDYRGPLAIHAAKHVSRRMEEEVLDQVFQAHVEDQGDPTRFVVFGAPVWDVAKLPRGMIVATADLVDVIPTFKAADQISWAEYHCGNCGPDRFAWKLENVRRLDAPIPSRGMQGVFDVPDVLRQANALAI